MHFTCNHFIEIKKFTYNCTLLFRKLKQWKTQYDPILDHFPFPLWCPRLQLFMSFYYSMFRIYIITYDPIFSLLRDWEISKHVNFQFPHLTEKTKKETKTIKKEGLSFGSGKPLTRKISHYRKVTSSMNLALFGKISQKK